MIEEDREYIIFSLYSVVSSRKVKYNYFVLFEVVNFVATTRRRQDRDNPRNAGDCDACQRERKAGYAHALLFVCHCGAFSVDQEGVFPARISENRLQGKRQGPLWVVSGPAAGLFTSAMESPPLSQRTFFTIESTLHSFQGNRRNVLEELCFTFINRLPG